MYIYTYISLQTQKPKEEGAVETDQFLWESRAFPIVFNCITPKQSFW